MNDDKINNCCCGDDCTCCLSLGDKAPDFKAVTTHGNLQFSEYVKDHWAILFSHPADFTPVCSTEFSAFAQKYDEFEKRGVKLMGLSVDSVYSHIAWVRDIEELFDVKVKFPIIADLTTKVAKAFGMIHPEVSEVHAIRKVVIVNPKREVVFMVTYPLGVGRNIDELIRVLDALKLVATDGVATPANWQKGDSIIIPPPQTSDEATKRVAEQKDNPEHKGWYLSKKKL